MLFLSVYNQGMDTLNEMLEALSARGFTATKIASEVDYHFSAIAKVMRGAQDSLPYEIGKKIEMLEVRTRRKKRK